MRRILIGLLSLTVGLAVAAAAVGLVRTAGIAAKTKPAKASTQSILKRQNALDKAALALRKASARRPPKLPKVPKFAHVHIPKVPAAAPVASVRSVAAAPTTAPSAASSPVIYKRKPPVVRYKRPAPTPADPSRGHEEEDEHEEDDEHEEEHEGGGGGEHDD